MTPRCCAGFVTLLPAGLTIVGAPPTSSPSLNNYPKCDAEVRSLAAELWGNCDGATVTEHKFGKGKAVWGQPFEKVFANLNTPPDFEFATNRAPHNWPTFHRHAGAADIYFVSNQRRQFDTVNCTFRVAGKTPELWHPDKGRDGKGAGVVTRKSGASACRSNLILPVRCSSFFVPAAAADHIIAAKFTPNAVVTPAAPELSIVKAEYGSFALGCHRYRQCHRCREKNAPEWPAPDSRQQSSHGGRPRRWRAQELEN